MLFLAYPQTTKVIAPGSSFSADICGYVKRLHTRNFLEVTVIDWIIIAGMLC
jgi:hypothetical protein